MYNVKIATIDGNLVKDSNNRQYSMSLVKVWTEMGNEGKCYSLPAKIVSKKGNNTFVIQYLSSTGRKTRDGKKIYMYEDETYEVTDNSITEYLETDSELDLGFEQLSDGDGSESEFVKYDSDSDEDYIPSEEDDDDGESSSSDSDGSSSVNSEDVEEEEDTYVSDDDYIDDY
jgi:hypothetical protein